MKDIAGSRTTYYSLAREILTKNHPKIFNSLLILALIFMTGLAVFLIYDILSFGSNSSYKGALVGLDLREKEKSILAANSSEKGNDQGLTVANTSDYAKGNLSRINNLSRQSGALGPSSSSRIGNSSPSSLTPVGAVAGDRSSSSSSNKLSNNKKDSTNGVIYHTHSSGSSSSLSKSAKESKSQGNLTQAKNIEMNQTSMNKTGINISLAKELEQRYISTLYYVGNNSSSSQAKDGSNGKFQVRIDFKTDLTTKSKSENSPNLREIGGETIPVSDIRSDSTGTTIESKAPAQKNVRKPAQTSRVTAGSKPQNRLQSVRDQQKANRNKLINNRKNQATQSRAIPQRRSQPTR